jgi:hypothetical protein
MKVKVSENRHIDISRSDLHFKTVLPPMLHLLTDDPPYALRIEKHLPTYVYIEADPSFAASINHRT